MNESFVEYLVQRKATPLNKAVQICVYIWTAFFLLFGFLGNVTFLFLGMIFGGISYFVTLRVNVEYEYLFLGKELSVDRIMARSKRKKLRDFDLGRMEVLAPAASHRLDEYKNRKCVTYDYSSRDDQGQIYCFYYEDDGRVARVFLDMSDELLACFRTVSPRKVFTD